MPFETTDRIWLDGAILDYGEARVGPGAHGLHYGTGVFEGIRCYEGPDGPAVFRLEPHLDRLLASAEVYGMRVPATRDALRQAVLETLRANGLGSCYIRPICFLGDETLGVHGEPSTHLAILAWPWAAPQGTEAAAKGLRVTLSPWVKFHGRMMPTTAKACGQYINSVLAVREARSRGFDEALLLNAEGTLAEGAVENLFLVKEGRLFTNDESASILPGITRASVLDLAADLGIPAEIGTLRLEQLQAADEAFFTGTAVEIAPIRELDGHPIGSGQGPVTRALREAFRQATTGRWPGREDWLTPVAPRPLPALART